MKRFLILISIIFFLVYTGSSQNTTSRLRIESGASIYFNFNSLQKYENGLEYSNWTKATVYFIDTTALGVPTALQWRLDVKAMSAAINGDAGNFLPLNTIEMEATGIDATYLGPIALSNADSPLVSNGLQTDPGITDVYISYYCGQSKTVANSLMGKKSDYYFVDIVFTLHPQ